jgi:tetratricopeptide (TPR) repeat protein
MYRLILTAVLGWSLLLGLQGQEVPDFNRFNQETYRLYLEGKWDSLKKVGRQALQSDIDFYYLRMRMGIACYQQKDYRKAIRHFEKALEFNRADPVALEYLYYARLMAGQTDQALITRKKFRGELAMKLPPVTSRFLDQASAEFLYASGRVNDLLEDPGPFNPLIPGVQNLTRYFFNATVSLSHRIAPWAGITQAYTYLNKTNHQYYNDGLYLLELPEQQVIQHQYYLSPRFTTPWGLSVNPALHRIGVRYQAPVIPDQGFQGGNNQVGMVFLKDPALLAGLQLEQSLGHLDLQGGVWYSNLNAGEQWQSRLAVNWFPLGNLNLYGGAAINTQWETTPDGTLTRFIPELHAGLGIAGKVWLTLSGSAGEMMNYHESNGLIIYNSFSEVMRKKLLFSLSVPVTEKGSLVYLGGRWSAHESILSGSYSSDPEINTDIAYQILTIYTGISWKF